MPKSQLGDFILVLALTSAVSATPGIYLLRKCLKLSTIMLLGAILAVAGNNSLLGFCPHFGNPSQARVHLDRNSAAGSLFVFFECALHALYCGLLRTAPLRIERFGALKPVKTV